MQNVSNNNIFKYTILISLIAQFFFVLVDFLKLSFYIPMLDQFGW